MYEKGEDCFYYITMYNEDYAMPPMPEGVGGGDSAGDLQVQGAATGGAAVAQLFGRGPILNEVLRAQEILAEKYSVAADVWSVTSYTELRRDAIAVERWNRLHPAEKERKTYIERAGLGEGTDCCGERLYEVAAGYAGAVADEPAGDAGDGWLWTQR